MGFSDIGRNGCFISQIMLRNRSKEPSKRQREAFRASLFARGCWIFMHVGILAVLLRKRESPIRDAFASGHVIYPLAYLALFLANLTLYIVASCKKPGYIRSMKDGYSFSTSALQSPRIAAKDPPPEPPPSPPRAPSFTNPTAPPPASALGAAVKGGASAVASVIDAVGFNPAAAAYRKYYAGYERAEEPSPHSASDPPPAPSAPSTSTDFGASINIIHNTLHTEAMPVTLAQGGYPHPFLLPQIEPAPAQSSQYSLGPEAEDDAHSVRLDLRALEAAAAAPRPTHLRAPSTAGLRALASPLGPGPYPGGGGGATPSSARRDRDPRREPLSSLSDAEGEGEPVTPRRSMASPEREVPVSPGGTTGGRTPRTRRKHAHGAGGAGGNSKFCATCAIWQPVRTKHCYDCGKCVARFDHHCMWVGNCIGRDNHCVFAWFVSTQFALAQWTLIQLFQTFEGAGRAEIWLAKNTALLVSVFILILTNLFLASLWCQHMWLILTNQTSYEQMKGDSLWYLASVPHNVYPFSKGLRNNVYGFCCGRGASAKVNLDGLPVISELQRRGETPVWYDNRHCSLC